MNEFQILYCGICKRHRWHLMDQGYETIAICECGENREVPREYEQEAI